MAAETIESPQRAEAVLRVAREVRSQFRFGFDGHDLEVVPLPPGNATRLTEQLANTVEHTLLQIVPLGAQSEVASSFADAIWRSVATDDRRHVAVLRLYLVPPGYTQLHRLDAEAIRRSQGRLQVRSLALRDLNDEKLAVPVTNLWLIDDAAVVSEIPDGLPRWQVSARTIDIERFQETWNQLWDRASQSDEPDPESLMQPLLHSVDAMADVAKMTCNQPFYGEDTCEWYHSVWQYLRIFGMVSNPDWHSEFYLETLANAIRRCGSTEPHHPPKVLVTGAADYSILAYALEAADRSGIAADVGVLDRCRTPLIACEWYARYRNVHEGRNNKVSIRVHEMDIFSAPSKLTSGYDLITADAYLTRFEPSDAEKVVTAWYQLLRLGGSVVTTVRLHPLDAPRGALLDEVSDFTLRAQAAAERWQLYLRAGIEDITAAARQYAVSMRSYDLGDATSVLKIFTTAGFEVEHCELSATRGELREATYLRVVAKKSASGDPKT
jgi:hypothetical protein